MRLAASVVACTVLAAACSSGDPAGGPVDDVSREARDVADATLPDFEKYTALGDSFTAAPLVPTTEAAGGCFRSDGNYPSILAEQLDIDSLVDVSCSGAETRDLVRRQRTVGDASVPPQLRVVDRDTDLVTLGIGGNDFGLFHTLVATCSQVAGEDPQGSPCADTLARRGIDLVARTHAIGARVERAVRQIQRRAPLATVLVVGYLRLAPATGRCDRLPFASGDYDFGARLSRALNRALERAARRTQVGFVDMYAASEGHDVCSADPWVNGQRTIDGEALALHPFAAGMEAVADEVVEALSR